ncbi:cell differentiation protein rcd1-like [Eucalyptus grandis]|uniref:cell differentiation protein rcd1-like n=1 Tax=Eucalyptus grandis TaxID=71139 RepID=UPI00192EAFFA|nr:cell differentiation protein rcd1-like [Eucalyptus grandis]
MEDFGKWFFGESSNLTGSCLSRAAAFFAEGQGMRFRMELQILALHRRETRRDALRFLVAHQEYHPKLGPMLWNTCNTVFVLLQEVFSAFPMLKVQSVTMAAAERASNALILIKCAASHRDAKRLLVNAEIQEYLYAILKTTHRDEPHDRLKLRSLEVINKLLEEGDEETVLALAEARMVLYCLRAILASPISAKEVAALVLQRILMNESGMKCCCRPICQFIMIARALTFTVEERSIVLSRQLLRRIAACFLCLSKHPRALEVLHDCLPMRLGDPYISNLIQAEPIAWEILREAAANLTGGRRGHRHVEPRVLRFGPIGKPPGTWVN